jgi:phosphoribosylformylglycinamidine (FGAM) synthase PurS component
MSEQEMQLSTKIANFILIKIMSSRTNVVDYYSIAKFMNITTDIVKMAAKQICNCLLNNPNVDDVDIQDDYAFDVILKRMV